MCGFIFPIAGILTFVLSFIICNEPEPFDHDVDAAFDEKDHAGVGAESSMAALTGGTAQVQPNAEPAAEKEHEMQKLESIPAPQSQTAN